MSQAILSDVEARAERRRTRTSADMWQDLAQQAWRRAQEVDPADPMARRWLERAHRLMPRDKLVASALAGALLASGELEAARALFQTLSTQDGTREAWTGLATCAHLLGDDAGTRAALAEALRATAPTPTLRTLADAVAGPSGWCGLTPDGVLQTGAVPATRCILEGVPTAGALPRGWRHGGRLEVEGPHGPMLGSPLPLARFAGLDGFVEGVDGGVEGWAWHQADPECLPTVHITGPLGTLDLPLTEPARSVPTMTPFAQPRRIALSAAEAARLGVPLAFTGPDGRHLLGSPLDPGYAARADFQPHWADTIGSSPAASATRPPVDVVVPVYRGFTKTLACLASVLATLPRGARLIVVDDASPEPELVAALQALGRQRRIRLISLPENRGFPAAANAGLRAAAKRDAVLLNSDTLVPPGWLERLRAAAYSAPDIGTVTPLTNDGTIVSYPEIGGGNPAPDLAGTVATDALAQQANGVATVDLPVGVGFCLYVRRDCLDQVGLLREDLFAQGYGEENDLCLRARHHGWRSVAAPGVFVAHHGATSFGPARTHLIRRNTAILARLHPGYDALVAAHLAADPLGPARLAMDALRWAAGRRRAGAVVFVTHGGGGGVDRVVTSRAMAQGSRRPIVLRPVLTAKGVAVQVRQPGAEAFPNLLFPMPERLPDLVRLLRPDRPRLVEQHHSLGHHPAILDLARLLRAQGVSVVHDYARFCPRIALVSTERRYCGEPDVPGCEACIADLGSLLEDDPPIPVLLRRSATELAAADRVIAPSVDAARRLERHFPGIHAMVEPWEDDDDLPPLDMPEQSLPCRVAVVGAIGFEKGFEVLLACVRDAKRRALPLEFVVVGFTADDERLMAAGPVFVTGEYEEDDAVRLIRSQRAHLALLPSVWPETWCFALTRAWQAGLRAAVFDLGAPAERVRATGRGWVVPLGLSAPALNDILLRLACDDPASHSLPP